MTAFRYCQSDSFRPASSPITGRRLHVNLSYDKVLVPADMNLSQARELGAELPAYWQRKAGAGKNYWNSLHDMRAAYHAFAEVETMYDFMSAIDRMLGLVAGAKKPRAYVFRALIWLTRLWSHGLVAIAPKWTTEYRISCPVSEFTAGAHLPLLEEIAAVASVKSPREARRAQGLALRIATATVGVRELGDLTPPTTAESLSQAMGTRYPGIVKAIVNAQEVHYGPASCPPLRDWGLGVHRVRKKSDVRFLWATESDPELEPWRHYLAQWLAERPVKSQALKLGEFFLNYLLANPGVTRNPEEFCRRAYTPPVPYPDWLQRVHGSKRALFDSNNLGAEFINWVLDARLSTPDDLGRPVRRPDHWNPITRMQRKAHPILTHREALPTRYIRELIRILTEDDFAWSKRMPSEWVSLFNHETGQWEKIWSPVRVSALLLKLYLPLRTIQVRMLDSGEADSERYVERSVDQQHRPARPSAGNRCQAWLSPQVHRSTVGAAAHRLLRQHQQDARPGQGRGGQRLRNPVAA